ncbi:MAG TPA: hypothetical protein VJI12_02310 [archaeon]|nr:hypothetical protein [archaeon]
MRVIKKFPESAGFVSKTFDDVIKKSGVHLPYSLIEFHVRDRNTTIIEDDKAVICIDCNSPFIPEKDTRALSTALRFELFRLMLRPDMPREIEDVIVGREMIKQGLGDDLFYLYYTMLMRKKPVSMIDYVHASIPWITFRGIDNYNSSFLKELLAKLQKKKFPEATKLLNCMCNDKFDSAVKEYNKLFAKKT